MITVLCTVLMLVLLYLWRKNRLNLLVIIVGAVHIEKAKSMERRFKLYVLAFCRANKGTGERMLDELPAWASSVQPTMFLTPKKNFKHILDSSRQYT